MASANSDAESTTAYDPYQETETSPETPIERVSDTDLEQALEAARSQTEPEVAGSARAYRVTLWGGRTLTLLDKPMLLWGAIAGAANFVFFLLTLFIFNEFGSTKQDVTNNAGLLNGVYCLSFLVPPALAFFAGLRTTAREGVASNGAMAGLWSLIFFEVLGLIYSFIALAVTNQLQTLDGSYWASFAVNFVFEGLIAFGAGYMGGLVSNRRRRQAPQQEALNSSL
jgi:hypothetical protein